MLLQLFIGGIMIGTSVLFQSLAFDFIIKHARRLDDSLRHYKKIWKALFLSVVVLAITTVLIIEIWAWALLYVVLDAHTTLETALYFSMACFSTVGFGDVILPHEWRLLSGIEATNGFLLFGWATAFIFEIVTNLYRKETKHINTDGSIH